MSFKDEMDKRLRRLCGVSDDTLRVEQDSETRYGGYCETCRYEEEVITVTVYNADGSRAGKAEFYDLGELMRDLDEVELEEKKEPND